jgi:galactose mutarotase-like enzyme
VLARLPFFRRVRPSLPRPDDFGVITLHGGDARVVIVPRLGGRIVELDFAGRQWLWASSVMPLAEGADGASYVETADSGGYDECLPTIGACRVPGWVRAFGGVQLPDHGELWSQRAEPEIFTSTLGQCAACTWTGLRFPYRFRRTVQVTPQSIVRMTYELENTGADKFPWLWSAHPLLPLTEHTRISLPEGTRLRCLASHGIDLGESSSEHRWPFVRSGGKVHDFVAPWDVGRRYACKLFLDMTHGSASIREGDHELSVRFDRTEVTHLGLWINKRGWTPFRDGEPELNLGFEPAIGAPDMLSDALGDWGAANWLEPGQQRRWTLEWRGRRIGAVSGAESMGEDPSSPSHA